MYLVLHQNFSELSTTNFKIKNITILVFFLVKIVSYSWTVKENSHSNSLFDFRNHKE